jgi:hypothetical protein
MSAVEVCRQRELVGIIDMLKCPRADYLRLARLPG